MSKTVYKHLTQPNVILDCRGTSSVPTYNAAWSFVENIYPWSDFTHQNIVERYASELAEERDFISPVPEYQDANLSTLYSERGFSDVLAATNMVIVSANLPKSQFIADGSRTCEATDIFPDWGAGDDSKPPGQRKRTKALVCGDTKYLWSHEDAIKLLQMGPANSTLNAKDKMSLMNPFEQVQYYGAINKTSIVFIISNEALVVIRLFLAPEAIRTSPRKLRSLAKPASQNSPSVTSEISSIIPRRQRISSISSDIVGSVSEMSIDEVSMSMSTGQVSSSTNDPSVKPTDFIPDINAMEYAIIPWARARADGLTVNLALWAAIRLARENNTIQKYYDPLTPGPAHTIEVNSGNISIPSTTQGRDKGKGVEKRTPIATDPVPKTTVAKTTAANTTAAKTTAAKTTAAKTTVATTNIQYCDVKLFPSSDNTGYNYRLNGEWVTNDPQKSWTVAQGPTEVRYST
ncbi:uncharacterized protein BP01DRAFT_390668 [Aspergillus saccharolyticus JOP 1030-1]|uniref:Uncharacterized protein n=1 Tax=Aspergillus saccharolyticus JOP 1030-1 TaxID=1450539 RepID=A0A318ZQZ9_9EURO|nr:hypothetical protein BP01DRAFT_390668 [Aspergillus saccharolyticus JOP 1030-1]PYH46380.1 hypothetical protein BP01DRAFT_390668 [Aspergillus saccharolyticus JOP 1030-1]